MNIIDVEGKPKIVSVVFVFHTEKSELAKRWRRKLEMFEKLGTIKLKVVERTGEKLTDILHKSNAWEDNFCDRADCLVCASAFCRRRRYERHL